MTVAADGTLRVDRIDEAPEMEAHFVDSHETPYGLGEPPLPLVAPAVANAVHDATGRRVRSVPLAGSGALATR